MAKKKNHYLIIGLAKECYFKFKWENPNKCYIILKKDKKGYYNPAGSPKDLRDLYPFMEGSRYSGITPNAREQMLKRSNSKTLEKYLKKIDIVKPKIKPNNFK